MLRRLMLVLAFASLTSTGCQTYTTGLQQGIARVDETAAIGALRTIAQAQKAYSVSNDGNYGTLQQLVDGGYLDGRFSSPKSAVKNYVLTMNIKEKSEDVGEGFFSCNADPERPGEQAGRHFYIDSTSGEIHANAIQPATVADQALQQ